MLGTITRRTDTVATLDADRVLAAQRLRKAFYRWQAEQEKAAAILGRDDADFLLGRWMRRGDKA